ncbi:MAG: hypothetical protein KDK99_19075 [Verrucomicrobiales bacterium]|nr:hypothetical protein [Verrucomicrobiales bacterium]
MEAQPVIYVWEYALRSGAALNAASMRRVFPGALILVNGGYGCIHPWPEFGDDPVEVQLEKLAAGVVTPVIERALHCAQLDGAARAAGVSLLSGLEVPRSHYSWSFAQETRPQVERLLAEAWPAVKAKGFAHWGETLTFLEALDRAMGDVPLRFRVDFNGCLGALSFNQFVQFMPLRTYRRLDWVEDPYPYEAETWQAARERWGIRLALDKGWRQGSEGFDAVIVKPARRDWRPIAERYPSHPLVLTSAMDHPLGQAFAAYEAAVARAELGDRVDLCGLCTQHLFAPDDFMDRIASPGGQLAWDLSGGGLGFGDLLERLPWRPL